ncbi:pleckstrin homology domain-containing family G member 6-like [Astyanax mexicanus]|uniref:Pleckstrin homology domain-containing family G member 6-like n=2 Tax=Astyanax mexicanus TaxID=7994 RepID=A0A8T2LXV6_ASTMX|nr:pleckstrin homology domain-containing family G member 6-like [Astyanax mexicanus]
MDGVMEKQREAEKEKDSDAADGLFAQHAETQASHRRATEKHKYSTLGYQKKKQRPVDFSTVSKGSSGSSRSRGALMQALFSQNASEKSSTQEDKGVAAGGQEQVEVLKQTLESFPLPAEISWRWGEEDKADVLEKSWTDIVHSHESMSKTQRHQQEALWELLQTELVYINKLTIITELVLSALEYVHQRGFLLEVTSAQLFSNLPSILEAHKLFWRDVMYPMLINVRQTGQPFDPLKLEPGCLQFAERFSAYLDYCWEEERNVEFTRRQLESNPQFQAYLLWVETHPQCVRMRLGDMQAKPHQRITKYPLLLKAILKTTEDTHTQGTLHRMLNSVGQFLDSINDYLQFKDDELALFDLSQRIEGYETQGMNEEIDKFIQEACRFDLTSPVQGMGPTVIRKLLMEETLKVRGRKDSKLEVVALLFTDVLLLTKSQKKSEKHKVVRPPVSLERTHCAELKDGYSFVLVEASDLGCAVNVYSVSAPSPESCTAWVSAINQAKEALDTLRRNQNQPKPKEPSEPTELEETETLTSPIIQVSENKEEGVEEQSEFTGTLSQVTPDLKITGNHLVSEEYLPVEAEVQNSHIPVIHASSLNKQMQNRDKKSPDETMQQSRGTESREYDQQEDMSVNERRVTWSHKPTDLNGISEDSENNKSNGPHSQESTSWQESWKSGEEDEALSESSRFYRKLKSPRLRRKRIMNAQPAVPPQGSRRMSDGIESAKILPNRNSSSNSDSDGNNSQRRPSDTASKPQDSHLVLKLGSLMRNPGVFWNASTERSSPDLQTLSEPELPKESPQNSPKFTRKKSQRRASVPEAIYTNSQSLPQNIPPRLSPSPPTAPDPRIHPSPLQGLLARAKERDRDRGVAKKEGKPAGNKNSLQSPFSVSSTPSPSPSEAEEQDLLRLHRGRESSVDGPEIEWRNSPVTPMGASVDWPGWCFDDAEVLEFLRPSDQTDWFNQTLTEFQDTPRHEDGEYSEV